MTKVSTGRVLKDLTSTPAKAKTAAKPTVICAAGFEPRNVQVLHTGRDQVWAYEADYKGKTSFHIRTVWFNDAGEANPGKGVNFPIDKRGDVLAKLAAMQ